MEIFKEIYNRECTNAINEGWEGFLIQEGVFVDFFNRNEEILQETMKDEIEGSIEAMDGFYDSSKVQIAIEYLFQKLGISGFYYEFHVQFDELELID